MTVEVQARFINELNDGYPRARDLIKEGDDHIRLVKNVLKNTLPNFSSSVTMTSDKLNRLDADIVYDSNTLTVGQSVRMGSTKNVELQNGNVYGVASMDRDDAVQPRSYNDARYAKSGSLFGDIPAANRGQAIANLFTFTTTADKAKAEAVLRGLIGPIMYPVGSLYYNADSNVNPATMMGFGTWAQVSQGRCIIGAGSLSDGVETQNFARGDVGGRFRHTLSVAEMPSHSHSYETSRPPDNAGRQSAYIGYGQAQSNSNQRGKIFNEGGSQPHNNMQPYWVVNVWKRVS